MNSIEELLGTNKPIKGSTDSNKSNKFKSLKGALTLYIKELKYPLTLLSALTVVGVASAYTLFDTESEVSVKHMYGSGKAEIEQIESSTHNLLTATNDMKNQLVTVSTQVEEKRRELEEANATVTSLTQGYYFIAYLDSLFNKHGITLDKFDINLQSAGVEGDLITVNNLVDVQIPKGDYSLLPLDIEFTTTSEGMRKLFNEFYTRRIVYDKDLKVTNNLDKTVTVQTKIEFTKATNTSDDPTQQVPVESVPSVETVPTEQPVDGAVQTDVQNTTPPATSEIDDWDLGGSSSGGTTDSTGDSLIGGTE